MGIPACSASTQIQLESRATGSERRWQCSACIFALCSDVLLPGAAGDMPPYLVHLNKGLINNLTFFPSIVPLAPPVIHFVSTSVITKKAFEGQS